MARASGESFEGIFLADNRYMAEGYRVGYDEGTRQGMQEGKTHGASHGARVSAEVSFYYGFSLTWKCLLKDKMDAKSRKHMKCVEALLMMIEGLPFDNPQTEGLLENMQKVRTKFRQVCSVLSVPTDFSDYTKGASQTTF